MGLLKLSSIALDPKLGLKDYSLLYNPSNRVRLKNILKNKDIEKGIKSGRTPSKFNEEYWNGDNDFLIMQDVDTSTFELKKESTDKITDFAVEEENTLYQAPSNSLIISNAMTVGLAFTINRPVYLNQNVFHIDLDEGIYSLIFLKWYFNLVLRKQFAKTFTSKYLSKDEFGRLRLPDIDYFAQKELESKLLQVEGEIKKLKSQIKPDAEIINEIFTKKFGWDTAKFNELKNVHLMNGTFNAFSNNIDNRFSFKFHNKAGEYVSEILKSQTSKRLKDFLAEDITLGKSISPTDYDENGEQYYVSMADIKHWCFETEEAKAVLQSYFDANPNKRIALNDIIMARSGEGTIGKVAIINNDENEAVYADFTMRIRFKDYNPTFAYYFFRTDFFQYLVYTHKKGLGNNTNIFPSQVRELPIPEISLAEQEKIVNVIRTETDKQREFDKKIKEKKDEINRIITDAIK